LSTLGIIGRSDGDEREDEDLEPVGDEDVEPVGDELDGPDDDESEEEPDDEEPQDEEPDDEEPEDEEPDEDVADSGETDISDVPAPSVGPHTTFEKDDPKERLARQEQSGVDAMGLDKRREVVGGSYSPSIARQLTTYGIVAAVVGGLAVGFVLLANNLDQAPDKYEDQAPWSQADARQTKPTGIDFPNYGHPGPGESPQATP
jgi:hypothetical protein